MPSSVIGLWISGSSTVASAARTACSTVPPVVGAVLSVVDIRGSAGPSIDGASLQGTGTRAPFVHSTSAPTTSVLLSARLRTIFARDGHRGDQCAQPGARAAGPDA